MQDLINALIFGIIEGITEFLPISSTGHLLIAQHWLGAKSELFNIGIQAGAILAVTLIYRKRLWQLATGTDKEVQAVAQFLLPKTDASNTKFPFPSFRYNLSFNKLELLPPLPKTKSKSLSPSASKNKQLVVS